MARKQAGVTDQMVVIRILDDPNGTPELGVTSATGGLQLYMWRRGLALSAFNVVSTLGGLASGYDASGLTSIINGYYRVDVPNSAFATGVSGVFIGGFATSMVIVGQDYELVTADTDTLIVDTEAILTDTETGLTERATLLTDTEAILADTLEIGTAGVGLSNIPWNASWDAEVQSEVNDALDTAISELGVGAPTDTPTIRTGLMLLYMALVNKLDVQTSGTDALEVRNAAGTLIAQKLLTDDGADYSEAKMISG